MNVLIACERTGRMRAAFAARGHWAVSCDLQPSVEPWHGFNPWHYQGDIREVLERRCREFYAPLNRIKWDLMVGHPDCTYLCNSGGRWLYKKGHSRNGIDEERWQDMLKAADFYEYLWHADIPRIALENPVMNGPARLRLRLQKWDVQFVQPWWFGDPFFKATGFRLKNLPPLYKTKALKPPKKALEPERHAEWSMIHRASPGPDRANLRSETVPGMAAACAKIWGAT